MATHSTIFASFVHGEFHGQRSPVELQPMELQKLDILVTNTHTCASDLGLRRKKKVGWLLNFPDEVGRTMIQCKSQHLIFVLNI